MTSTQQNIATEATLLLDVNATLGEGALWHPEEKRLYWVDIEGQKLHLFDPATKEDKVWPLGARVGTVVAVVGGGALVALQNGIHWIDTRTGELTFIANPIEAEDIRFNDGKCDPAGRFWVGTMALDTREGAAVLYRMDSDGTIHPMVDKLTISNGIVWTADKKTMYLIDTPTLKVQAFDYDDAGGRISNRRDAFRVPAAEGSPDGMTIDAEGNLWIALHGGGAVARFDPLTGGMLQKITVPAPQTTSCAFGGENLDTLYITTARQGLSEEQLQKYPYSGGLFSIKPGVRGIPASFYKTKV